MMFYIDVVVCTTNLAERNKIAIYFFKEDYFQSAAKGQEFVIQADKNLQNWTKELIENN